MKMRNKLNTSPGQRVSLSVKIILGIAGSIAFLAGILLLLQAGSSSTITLLSGNWSNVSIWSGGIPDDDATADINHSLTLDKNITIAKGSYTINAPVTDPAGGTAYSLSIDSDGLLEVNANMTFEGSGSVSNQAKLIIRSGDTLRLGATVFDNGSSVLIDEGGVLIINGNLQNKNNSDGIVVNGTIIVDGDFTGGNGSAFLGNGNFTTTGSITGAGTIFGSSPLNCNSPCDGRSLVGFTNSISSNQTICKNNAPAILTGATSATSPTYIWQQSINNDAYTTITGATASSYSPGALTATTWYRRILTSGGKSSTSAAVKITIITKGLWTGAVSDNWNTLGNWCGSVPLATDDVIIPAECARMPVIPAGSFSCNTIHIQQGASLTMNSGGILSLKGDIINNGTYIDKGGTLLFSGTSSQTIFGINSIGNLTLNNSTGLNLTNPITVNGIIKLLDGAIVSQGKLTVNLDKGGIAYQSTDKGSIIGDITVRKNVQSNLYHYLSSPLLGQTIQDWNDNVSIESGRIYYYYDETNTNTDNAVGWVGINNLTTSLVPMKGYALYFRSSRVMDNVGAYTHGAAPVSINLTNTKSGGQGADGWNLAGNPYPSTIDWDAPSGWTKTNVYGAIYCWDPLNTRYTTYVGGVGTNGGSRYISSMQAFWVRVDTSKASGKLASTSAVRSTNSANFYRRSTEDNPLLKLVVTNNGYIDETVIRFMNEATDAFDGEYDASKKINSGNNPSLYTEINGISYAINSLHEFENNDEMEIPLSLQVPQGGLCQFSAKELTNFDPSFSIILEDKKLKTFQDLSQNPHYEFNANNTQDSGRFILRIKRISLTTSIHLDKEEKPVKITLQDKMLYVRNANTNSDNASVYIFSTTGTEIGRLENIHFTSGEYMHDMSGYRPGMYIVKVLINKNVVAQKILLP